MRTTTVNEFSRAAIDIGALAALLADVGVHVEVSAARQTAVNLRRRRILFSGRFVHSAADTEVRWLASTDIRAPSDWRSPASARYCCGIGVDLEADVIRCLGDHAVPVPALVAVADAPTLGGATLVSAFVSGAAIPKDVFAAVDAGGPGHGESRAAGVAATLASFQAISPAALPAGLERPVDPALTALEAMTAAVEELLQPAPVLALALRWLRARRPGPTGTPCLVHGDFRIGRIVFDTAGIAAVIDWDAARVGDPLEDLAWFCLRTWRAGRDDLGAGGLAPQETLLQRWSEACGIRIDDPDVRSALKWWTVMGTFRRCIELLDQARAHIDGTVRDLDMAASGSRIAELEFDLLRMIRPDA